MRKQKIERDIPLWLRGVCLVAIAALIAIAASKTPTTAQAQGPNLLANPSFEGAFQTFVPNPPISDCPAGPCTTAQMAAGWLPWWVSQDPQDKGAETEWRNRMPEYKKAEAPFLNRVHHGESAQQYFTFWSSHTAGIYQRVSVPRGVRLRFSIYGQAWSTHDDEPTSNTPTAVNMRIGIDPTGGTSPFGGNIIWSGAQNPYDNYAPFVIETVSQNNFVTVFTYAMQSEPRKHNDIYWDNASLVALAPPATPTPNVDWQATRAVQAANWVATQTRGAQEQIGQATAAAQQAAATAQANQANVAVAAPQIAAQPGAVNAPAVSFTLRATPTPNADGVIMAAVPPGGSIWSVAANAGITLDEILEYNSLSQNSFVSEGQLLIVGYGDPNGGEPTVEESAAEPPPASENSGEPTVSQGEPADDEAATAQTDAQPAAASAADAPAAEPAVAVAQLAIPTPQRIVPASNDGVAVAEAEIADTSICLLAFDDANQNGQRDGSERLRPNVAFTLVKGQQVVSNYVTTGAEEPYCIAGLDAGNYQISRSKLSNEKLTTQGEWGIALSEGSIVTLEFGSFVDADGISEANSATDNAPSQESAPQTTPNDSNAGSSNWITYGAVGLAILLLLGVILLILSARRPTY